MFIFSKFLTFFFKNWEISKIVIHLELSSYTAIITVTITGEISRSDSGYYRP